VDQEAGVGQADAALARRGQEQVGGGAADPAGADHVHRRGDEAHHVVDRIARFDAVARALGYDSISTAVTYLEESAVPKFQAEGYALRAWRSRVRASCYSILAEAEAGTPPAPGRDELLAELPAFVAPSDAPVEATAGQGPISDARPPDAAAAPAKPRGRVARRRQDHAATLGLPG
jgi:hypothetical protein